MKMQLVRGLTRTNADPDNPRESAFIRVPFSRQLYMMAHTHNERKCFAPLLLCAFALKAFSESAATSALRRRRFSRQQNALAE
jgi:hypothetical protein